MTVIKYNGYSDHKVTARNYIEKIKDDSDIEETKRRICKIPRCKTILSQYNYGDYCLIHCYEGSLIEDKKFVDKRREKGRKQYARSRDKIRNIYRRNGKFIAQVTIQKKTHYVGYFDKIVDAVIALNKFKKKNV